MLELNGGGSGGEEVAVVEREAAEMMIGEVREDEPVLAGNLRVEAIDLG